ncbi:hypothetical protein [Chryseobacterium sp.]|uniref:hypothetical protein n=1 Tax=Chryseobacterium sp. TaxID=1871047 RepID=UPI00289CA71F|nr:hypothetical protein [Chryseobacterium sp.]
MKKSIHFKALINYKSAEKGGSVSPISAGFRASFQFSFELKTYIGVHVFEEDDLIYAGDSSTLDITLVDAEGFVSKLHKGLDFEILDNSGNIIGTGIVTEVYS